MSHPLIDYRRDQNLTREALAARLGVTVAMVGHVERGVRRFSAVRAVAWERELGIPARVTLPELFADREAA
jgi:transcriptional regulator with XRE-family HTH domain